MRTSLLLGDKKIIKNTMEYNEKTGRFKLEQSEDIQRNDLRRRGRREIRSLVHRSIVILAVYVMSAAG
jgi:major membrane immunogen (membrane-anchored lipoprotein)